MRRITDEHDTAAVPGRHVDLADGVEVQLGVVERAVKKLRDFPFGVTGETIGEQAFLSVKVMIVIVDPGRAEYELREGLILAGGSAARSPVPDNELSALLRTLRAWLKVNECESDVIHTLLNKLIDVLHQMTDGNYATISDRPEDAVITKDAMSQRFIDVITPGCSWWDAIEAYDAPNAVPLMTIHRSKGLEYHTVFFLGLEDRQWWSHSQDVGASTSTFFVGLSRAAQRIIFTRCNTHGEADGIASFYEILDEAGIVTESFT